jgi:thiol-disulfide isomerase/thioredoxin
MKKKIMFWAKECPHCRNMMPLVDRLIEEEGVEIEKLEIWHNEENADLMRSFKDVIAPKCGGQLRTPTFFDSESNDVICGEVEYEVLKDWALK